MRSYFTRFMRLIAVAALLTASPARAAELMVFAAASLTDVLREIARSFTQSGGVAVQFNFASSSLLARQIQDGAPADIFFSADEEKMDQLAAKGLIDQTTRFNLLSNSLVVVVRNDNRVTIARAEDLREVRRLALGETSTVPAGIYARRYLEGKGLWNELQDRVIPTENVRAALAAVESGNADAAIVYRTDAAVAREVRIALAIPASEAPPILYPVAVTRESRHIPEAKEFLEFLRSGRAAAVFEKFGFALLKH